MLTSLSSTPDTTIAHTSTDVPSGAKYEGLSSPIEMAAWKQSQCWTAKSSAKVTTCLNTDTYVDVVCNTL